jgi:hypothetical protein
MFTRSLSKSTMPKRRGGPWHSRFESLSGSVSTSESLYIDGVLVVDLFQGFGGL